MTTVQTLASWASSLTLTDIPDDVRDLLRAQRLSVLGGIAASKHNETADRVLTGMGIDRSEWPFDRSHSSDLAAAAVLSVALDFDDYMCFGHTGHTAVSVPLIVGRTTGADSAKQMMAQAAANEIGARLGGACLIGPLNGQMWSFIHAAQTAVAAGLLMNFDVTQVAHALAIALYQSPRPVAPGFFNADTKLLTVADPALSGLRAAELAAAGVSGPLEVLDHPHGFLSAFSYAPLRSMFGGLGKEWASRTLTVKQYPGCAYIDSTIDCLMDMGRPKPEDIQEVAIEAGLLTCGMEAWSGVGATGRTPTPVELNFSVVRSAAVALLAQRLTPEEMRERWLNDSRGDIEDLAARIKLKHNWELTREGAVAMRSILPAAVLRRDVGTKKLLAGLRRMARDHRSVRLRVSEVPELVSWARQEIRASRGKSRNSFWQPGALDGFQMKMPARVRVTTKGGRVLEAEATIPQGAAGHVTFSPNDVAKQKFKRWAPELWGVERARKIAGAVAHDADDLGELVLAAN